MGRATGDGSRYTGPERRMKNLGLHVYSIVVAVAVLCLIVSGAMVANQNGTPEGWHQTIGALVAVMVMGLGVRLVMTKTEEWIRRLGRAAVAMTIADAGLGLQAGPGSAPAFHMAHAFLAPMLLSVVLAIAVATQMSPRPVRANSIALKPASNAMKRVPPWLRLRALRRTTKSLDR